MEGYLSRRSELISATLPGTEAARALAVLTDEAVSALAEAASSRLGKTWAVVALGGYGAGRLLPSSDLDLLLLSEDDSNPVREAARALFYPLWDAGLKVGHQVRSRKQHLRACRDDVETLTASLTGRVLAGDAAYAERVLADVAAGAKRRAGALLPRLAARPRPEPPYLLEPDIKEGAGGQRDLDEIAWTAAIVLGRPGGGMEAAVRAGILVRGDLPALSQAAATLTAARWELGARGLTRMTLPTAEEMRTEPECVQEALCVVADALEGARARVAGAGRAARGPRRRGARADSHAADRPASGSWMPGTLFAALAEADTELVWRAAWRGELETLVPGLRTLMPLRRPALSHTLTVGAHCIAAASSVAELSAAESSLAASLDVAGDLRPVMLAALVHDAGKAVPGPGHAERSVPALRLAAERCALSAEDGVFAERLVREHLLLPEAALHTDPEDASTVAELANRIGDERTLGALHLLSAADSRATGPAAWSAWHAALLATLVSALRDAMHGERPSAHDARAERDPLVAEVGATRRGSAPVFRVSPGPAPATWRLTLAAHDRPGFFADAAGVLALAGLDVLSASANAADDDIVLDTFTVRSATGAAVTHDVWAKVERLLTAAWNRHLSIATRLEERRHHYPAVASSFTPVVRFDTSDPARTLVTVHAADRVGLLHDIASALAQSSLSIEWANAIVEDGIVRDVFRVTSEDGSHREPGVLGHVAMRIRERLGP